MITAEPNRSELGGEHDAVRRRIAAHVQDFVKDRCMRDLHGVPDAEHIADLFADFLAGGKYLRSMFTYIGWRSRAPSSDSALRAAGSLELLHGFALMQDDVMDGSTIRRGKPAVHVRLAEWHRRRELSGSPERFGASAAVVLGDLALVWAEQMLRHSGLHSAAVDRAWPYYDQMRAELAIGQLADLVNDARRVPSFEDVLAVARRKSGNYTVRDPLVLGALLAGCESNVLDVFRVYGSLIGEAFQLRDDLFGIFGRPAVTGKPTGEDLRDRKATTVVVLARELASPHVRAHMDELFAAADLTDADLARSRELIRTTSAEDQVEELITQRVADARRVLSTAAIDETTRTALSDMAMRCTDRDR